MKPVNGRAVDVMMQMAMCLHYARMQAHDLPFVEYRDLPIQERAALEELALRLLDAMAPDAPLSRIGSALARLQLRGVTA